ncbi:hypothetical protein GCM10027614_30590 [Micromonospora vulcania]
MIQHLDVDGVPTLLAPTGGPMHAGLTFRVGTADETLGRAGITHLLEHLALAPLGLADYHVNGSTAQVFTTFHTQGSGADIAAFLTAVCGHLSDLPLARLDVEKEILRTEWSSRGAAATDDIPLWRYGARDYGLTSYPEWGLGALTADDLRQWAARWFTRENAVLWIAGGQVPAGLRLALPAGTRQPVPVASSALPRTPAYFVGGSRAVVLDSVVRRRTRPASSPGYWSVSCTARCARTPASPTPPPPGTSRAATGTPRCGHSPTRWPRSRAPYSAASSTCSPSCGSGGSTRPTWTPPSPSGKTSSASRRSTPHGCRRTPSTC